METIYKYVLPVSDVSEIELPEASKILSVAFQGDDLCIWALVSTERPMRRRVFHVRGTGHDAMRMRSKVFIGTAFHPLGLVFHIWEG